VKRVFVMLVAGTALSGAAALYATSTAKAVEKPVKPLDTAAP
jgi:hypothetical protein